MRGGALPPALLAAALGLALAFAPRRDRVVGLVLFITMAVAVAPIRVPSGWQEGVFAACWLSTIATAASVHLPRGPTGILALALAFNAGLFAGAVVASAGVTADLAKALPWCLVAIPASRLATTRASIGLKVVASWLIAIAALIALLPLLPVTPGYAPDHLD